MDTRLGLAGRVAVVTTGTRGLGLAVASKLCDNGVHVVVTCEEDDVHQDRARTVLADRPGSVTVLPADIGDEDSVAELLEAVIARHERLDIFVHSTTSPDLSPLVRSADRLVKAMAGEGRVVVVAYSVTPVEKFVRALAVELAPWQITANAVVTAVVDNGPMNMDPDLIAQLAARSPSGRLPTPRDVADAVALLCADEAALIQGQVVAVDGGLDLLAARQSG